MANTRAFIPPDEISHTNFLAFRIPHLLARSYCCNWNPPDTCWLIFELKKRRRDWFKPWAIAVAWCRCDRSTFSSFETVKINSATTSKLYIGIDVHKEKSSLALADPGAAGKAACITPDSVNHQRQRCCVPHLRHTLDCWSSPIVRKRQLHA